MIRKCNSLKPNEPVIFLRYSNIYCRKIHETGSVSYMGKDFVNVCWLEGYKNRDDVIPFRDMVAVYNPNGEYMRFDNISGCSDLLIPE